MLARSAGSVLAQSFRDLELIVVDDGSSDDIPAALAALGDDRLRYARRETTGGPSAARNIGLALARGEFIAFQDSDDEWLLNKLAIQVQAIEQAPQAALCLGSMLRVIGDGFRVFQQGADARVTLAQLAQRPIAYTQTWLVRRQQLLAAGGFDESLWIWEDWDLLLRIAEQSVVIGAPEALCISARQQDSLTQSNDAFIQAAERILAKHQTTFARLPRQKADFHYQLAHRLFDAQGGRAAAHWFGKTLRLQPGNLRAWVYWLLCRTHVHWLIPHLRGTLSRNRPL